MEIQEKVWLKEFTTFRIGGPARYFCRADDISSLKEAVDFARSKNVPVFPLGGGSNVLVSDEGFPGLVIKIEIKGAEFIDRGDEVEVIVGAGEHWDTFVGTTIERGLYGLENLSLIPGTVGGAPVQNIGAYGVEVKDTISWVEAFDPSSHGLKRFSNTECSFSYRNSFFKTPAGKPYLITRVSFLLKKHGALKTDYKDVAEYFESMGIVKPGLSDVRDAVVLIRQRKLPDVAHYGTAGSFFKNPVITAETYNELKKKFPAMLAHPTGKTGMVKVSLAWILDNVCGFRGVRLGNVGVYQSQALVLVNFDDATSEEVRALAKKMIVVVKEKTGIVIEPEVEFVPK